MSDEKTQAQRVAESLAESIKAAGFDVTDDPSAASIEFVFPLPDDDRASIDLRFLTQSLHERMLADGSQGGLFGGEFGYGADFENATFLLHRYCWCEKIGCPWCYGCFCGDNEWREAHETDAGVRCSWCSDAHLYEDKGALPPNEEPHMQAPNFWHKASGVRVWWYKYIGRGMKYYPESLSLETWERVVADCIESISDA